MLKNSSSNRLSISNLKPSLRGRLGRQNYLAFLMFWNCIMLLSFFIGSVVTILFNPEILHIKSINILWIVTLVAVFIYALSNVLTITVRRLHDINLSGWWIIPLFIPIVGGFMTFITFTLPGTLACSVRFAGMSGIQSFLGLPAAWIYFPFIYGFMGFWWLNLFIIPGTPLPNRFGEITPKTSKQTMYLIFGAGALLLIISTLLFLLVTLLMSAHGPGCC